MKFSYLSLQISLQTTGDQDLIYTGALTNYDVLKAWAQDKCIPLVREITFENGEELTEEGMPFMLLFHKPDDKESLKTYTEVVARDLYAEKGNFQIYIGHITTTINTGQPV